MKAFWRTSFLVLIHLFFFHHTSNAQSSVCDSITPRFFVDLTGDPDSNYLSPSVVREGICCNITITSPPPRCIEFEVTLDSGAVGLAFDIYSGARPTGALFYQINCGPLVAIGDTICLDGPGPHTLTFCKPGANQNIYTLQSIPGTLIPETNTTRAGCETVVGVTGLVESTIRWRDVSSPNLLYQSYLSCDSACDTVFVITPKNAPAFVDYEICGRPIASFCNDSLPDLCDTVRVYISPPLDIQINPNPPIICLNEGSRTLSVSANLDRTNFSYSWLGGPLGPGTILGSDSTLLVTLPGTYSVIVEDTVFGECSRDTTTATVSFAPPPIVQALNDSSICIGDSIPLQAFGALTYQWSPSNSVSCDTCAQLMASPTTSSWYRVTGTDANGCQDQDSVFIEVFNIDSTFINQSICPEDSILLGGIFRSTAGQYVDTLQNANGCDSLLFVNLSLFQSYQVNLTRNICQGDSIFLGGNFRNQSGTYTDSLLSVDGCDSLILTTLTVFPSFEINQLRNICQGDSILLAGTFQKTPGVYADSLLTTDGCDSVILTTLNVFPTYTINQQANICQGDSILLGGVFRFQAGTYTDSLQSIDGCDSITIYNLTILPIYTVNQQARICPGDSILLGASFRTQAGVYTDSLLTVSGCDSLILTTLSLYPDYIVNQQANICQGDSILIGGVFRSQAGIYTDSLQTINGCDSIILTDLSILPVYSVNQAASICEGDSILLGGRFQTQAGIYTDSLQSTNGCDSLILTTLTIFPAHAINQTVSICTGDSIFLGGAFRNTAGTYTDSLASVNGCDSLIQTQLVISSFISTDLIASICQGDSLLLGGIFRTQAGIYTDSLVGRTGCDSLINTTLNILPTYVINTQESICRGDSMLLGGIYRSQAGVYTDSLLSINGCDSLILTTLNILPVYVLNLQEDICQGDSIFLAGNFQSQAGTYTDSLLSVNGCDSLIITSLNILPNYVVNEQANICQGDSIFLGGLFRTQAGIYTDSLLTSNGCDSLVITDLSIFPTYEINLQASICQGDSILLGGIFRTQAGVYTDSLLSNTGCDSLINTTVNIFPTYAINVQESICQGDSILLGGIYRSQAGVYTDSLLSINGCDSLILTTLNILPVYVLNLQEDICQGDSIFLAGNFQSQAGTYTDSLLSVNGCDSLIITSLNILPNYVVNEQANICQGDSIFLGGLFRTQAGIYTDSLLTSNGCDSLVITDLSIFPTYEINLQASICQGDSLLLGGIFRTQAGVYTDSLLSNTGCDSLINTTVNIFPTYAINVQESICRGDSMLLGGIYRSQAGVYTDSLLSINGCDSLILITLTVAPTYTINLDATICEGDSIFLGGSFQTQAGMYTDSLLSVEGCDSLLFTNLIVFPTYTSQIRAEICPGDSLFLGGSFQTQAGVYIDSLFTQAGCDSLIITSLSILPNISSTQSTHICEGDSIFLGGQFQREAGVYSEILTAANGCDSTVFTELSIVPQPILTIIEDQELCIGEEVELWAEGSDNFLWSPDTGLSCTTCKNPIASPESNITYYVSIEGCGGEIIEDSVRITVHELPVVDAGLDQEIYLGETVELSGAALSLDSLLLSWSSDRDGLLCSFCTTTSQRPEVNTTYKFSATTDFGCYADDLVEVKVINNCVEGLIEIPNLFTPNGDGVNDEFYIRNIGPGQLRMLRIYNRWGQKVFESNNISDRWDGTFRGGSCNPGVFAYYLEIGCPTSEKVVISGDITLLK